MNDDNEKYELLSEMEEAFCRHYVNRGEDTYNNGTLSAKQAGYSETSAHTAAWKLLRRPRVKARLQELYAELSAEFEEVRAKVLSHADDLWKRALAKHDLATAFRCIELLAKCGGVLQPEALRLLQDTPEQPEISARQAEEARRLAELRMAEITGNTVECSEADQAKIRLRIQQGKAG